MHTRPYPQPEDRQRWITGIEDEFVERARRERGEEFTKEDEHFARWRGQCIAERVWDIRHPSGA